MHIVIGERYFVRPTSSTEKVQRGANLFGQFLPAEGQECIVDEFLLSRHNDGSVTISSLVESPKVEPHQSFSEFHSEHETF